MEAFTKRKSSVFLSGGIFPICKASGEKRIRCFSVQCAIPNSFLLYCFNTNKAKRFILHLVVRDPWPLFKPRTLKGSIGQLFVPKLLLWKRKSLRMIRFITQFWKKLELRYDLSPRPHVQNCSSACISKSNLIPLWVCP